MLSFSILFYLAFYVLDFFDRIAEIYKKYIKWLKDS